MRSHKDWFDELTEGSSGRAAAMKAGVHTSRVNRQLAKEDLSPDVVIALARAYGRSPIRALAETGYLTPEEVTGRDETSALELASDRGLIRELARRVGITAHGPLSRDLPLGDALHQSAASPGADESPPGLHPVTGAGESPADADHDGNPTGERYVAYGHRREPSPGDPDYNDGP